MNIHSEYSLKIGGDPRTFPDYAALCDELDKLTHPARPDVAWQRVETLCLSLFERNGVELQSLAWYTLARIHLSGLLGLNEGLALLEALLAHQWHYLWPQAVHARVEILSGLSKRLQQVLRMQTFTSADLGKLYQAEQHLTHIGDVLQRLELKHLSESDALRAQLHHAALRLESDEHVGARQAAPPVSTSTIRGASERAIPTDRQWIFVVQPEQGRTRVHPGRRRRAFIAGLFTMLVVGSASLWGWQYLHRPQPLDMQPRAVILRTQQQIERLSRLPVDNALRQQAMLVHKLQTLFPADPAVKQFVHQWQQQLSAAALPVESLSGWHQGMMQLKQLTDRLNSLDEQHGKYMTVSELKSQVFAITQALNQMPPVEEQLRQIAAQQQDGKVSPALKQQTEAHLNQLLIRFFSTQDAVAPGSF
ncbi:VasL domain-containing protein [Pseudescherichia sp.]|uniref:VasL domain-containing protein n=1 Tax=Pseudescherichia sp. TaxID=2055881 RepID=UPI0028A1BB6E|nr:VasL domain-containing protein [Pseudescherichia sp.]